MNPNEIKWLDGKDADGMYILEILYNDGTKGYLKNKDRRQIDHYCSALAGMAEVKELAVHEPSRMKEAA